MSNVYQEPVRPQCLEVPTYASFVTRYGPPPSVDRDPNAIYEWEGTEPHRCCACGWTSTDPRSTSTLGALWLWAEPRDDAAVEATGLEWVCPECVELNLVCATDHTWTTCPQCRYPVRSDWPTPHCGEEASRKFGVSTCREDHVAARSILVNACASAAETRAA